MGGTLVSIIIPIYNVEKYLPECLDSVLKQSYRNVEIICVEDASTDNSLTILREYAKKDSRIKIIQNKENKGLSTARNIGFSHVMGQFTYYLDSDDYIKENAIEELVYYAEKCDVECIFFDSVLLIETEGLGGPKLCYSLQSIDKKVYTGPELFKIMKEKGVYTNSVWRRFWKTEFLKKNGLKFADGLLAEDTLFSLKAILCGERMMVVNKSYHVYRRREGTLSTAETPLKVKSLFRNYCMLLDFWKEHRMPEDIEEILSKHLEDILISAKRVFFRLKDEIQITDYEPGIERHLFSILMVQNYEKYLDEVSDEIVKKIKAFKNVIVYGAGRYSAEVVEKLTRKGIEIKFLAVTQLHANAIGINGIPVKQIDDLCYMKKNAVVILGVGKSNREEVINTLKKNGFENYLEIE